jgi:hypothetical protein
MISSFCFIFFCSLTLNYVNHKNIKK